MDKIDFPGLDAYTRGIGSDGVWRSPRRTNYNIADKCVDGLATKYNTPVEVNGELRAFVPGCFEESLRSGKAIQFRLQHEAANVVATTRDNLTIVDDPKVGLTFRLRVPKTMLGQIVASMIQKESRTNMSIGYTILDDVVRNIAGRPVRLITKADLVELSLVKEGAIRRAFAMLVDGAYTRAPRAGDMSLDFKLSSIAHNLNLAAKDYRAMLGLDADASSEVTA